MQAASIPVGGNNCGGIVIAGTQVSACDLTTDDLGGNGGSITLPYTATLGSGGQLFNAPARNCAYVDIPSAGLHAPGNPGDKACVAIPLKTVIIDGGTVGGTVPGGVFNPNDDGGGLVVIPGGSLGTTTGVSIPANPNPAASIVKTCAPLVFPAGASVAQANCTITITTIGFQPDQITSFYDALNTLHPIASTNGAVAQNISGMPGLSCFSPSNSNAVCNGPAMDQLSAGGTFVLSWSAQVTRPKPTDPPLENCVTLLHRDLQTNGVVPVASDCHTFEVDMQPKTQVAPVPDPARLSVTTQSLGACQVNRSSQNYECINRISVRNLGDTPHRGPLVVQDQFGRPGVRAIQITSGNGWACGKPVDGAVSCVKPDGALGPNEVDSFDLVMVVNGARKGGQFESCVALGVSNDRQKRVALAQTIMNQRGLNAGPVDGKPGRKTYAALARLQQDLGLPVNQTFDDRLFAALGIPVGNTRPTCATVNLPAMPAPPLQCGGRTTVTNGEGCASRFDGMAKVSATRCGCGPGFDLVNGQGCQKQIAPRPKAEPTPTVEPRLACDQRSTRLRGDKCVCIDQKLARDTSATTCGCRNGLPMVNGRCIPPVVQPHGDGPAADNCRVKVAGVCLN